MCPTAPDPTASVRAENEILSKPAEIGAASVSPYVLRQFKEGAIAPKKIKAANGPSYTENVADTTGGGRLDRVESVLEVIGERLEALTGNQQAIQRQHDEDFKKLMTWQVLMQDKFERLVEKQEQTDERIRTLISAIGEFVRRF